MENETIFCLTLSGLSDVRKGLLSMSAVANYFSSFDTLATNTVDESVKTVMLVAYNIDEIHEVKKLLDDNGINQMSIGDRTLGIEDACICFVVDDCVDKKRTLLREIISQFEEVK